MAAMWTGLSNKDFLHKSAPASLFQHPAWLEWKKFQGWRLPVSHNSFPALSRPIAETGSMAYVVGPFSLLNTSRPCNDERGALLENLSEQLLPLLPSDCVFIRWDLMVKAWTDDSGKTLGRPLRELRMNASTKWHSLRKAPIENTSLDTMIVNLAGGEAAIWNRMEARARYSVRLASRRGTAVKKLGEEGLPVFYALYRETAQLRGLYPYTEALFRELFQSARAYGLHLDLYIAISNGEPAAAAIIARIQDEAWYLFAASSAKHRAAAAPSAILYQAMIDCARAGSRYMDLLGVAPPGKLDHPLAGLSLFKKGFGGQRHTRAGAWDYVLDQNEYIRYASLEALK